MRPTVGITAATETINYGAWQDVPAFMSPANYVRAVQRAGGRPVLLIPDREDTENPSEVLNLVDRRHHHRRRRRPRPGTLRPGTAPADRTDPERARRLRARPGPRRRRTRDRHFRHLPRYAGAQRRLRRHGRATPAGSGRPRKASSPARRLRRPRGTPRAGLTRRPDRRGGGGGG